MADAKGVRTPGVDERAWEEEENGKPVPVREASSLRAVAARTNILAMGRADAQ